MIAQFWTAFPYFLLTDMMQELYERSVQLEGSGIAGGTKSRRNWFQLKASLDQRA
jgi:hypothetical protein